MEIRPVKSEADYNTALKEIDRLWGAPESTPDGDSLDVLLILVENYESKYHPIDSPDPIEATLQAHLVCAGTESAGTGACILCKTQDPVPRSYRPSARCGGPATTWRRTEVTGSGFSSLLHEALSLG